MWRWGGWDLHIPPSSSMSRRWEPRNLRSSSWHGRDRSHLSRPGVTREARGLSSVSQVFHSLPSDFTRENQVQSLEQERGDSVEGRKPRCLDGINISNHPPSRPWSLIRKSHHTMAWLPGSTSPWTKPGTRDLYKRLQRPPRDRKLRFSSIQTLTMCLSLFFWLPYDI